MTSQRNRAESTTLLIAICVLLLVVAVISSALIGPRSAPEPTVEIVGIRPVDDDYHVSIVLRNDGDQSAAEVQIQADLLIAETVVSSTQTVDVLAGSESVDLTFVFADNPADGTLEVFVTGFAEP